MVKVRTNDLSDHKEHRATQRPDFVDDDTICKVPAHEMSWNGVHISAACLCLTWSPLMYQVDLGIHVESLSMSYLV